MEKYSCFCCPSKDYSEKELTDRCPSCNNEYGFPLNSYPERIADIEIVKPLARGFYGATYIGEIAPFGGMRVKKVIKIIPVELYKFHNKDFKQECERHLEIALNSTHIVNIDTGIFYDSREVEFSNGVKILCHVIGLSFIDGVTLKNFLSSNEIVSVRTITQIAIDLINILQELRQNEKFHNDLHPGNLLIEQLTSAKKRPAEIDENIKVVAIDLGSLDQKTKSNDDADRIGDVHWVAQCLNALSRKITDNPDYYDEKDWRLAFLLEEKADFLKPSITSQKQITFKDLIQQIKDTFYQHTNPWQEELKLKSFDDSVNAQSLRPWYVPNLFVDKNNSWINSISIKGPQVITGMRGCGKTMLLRALEFHARVVPQSDEEVKDKERILSRLNEEGYLGLYISCVKLLDFSNEERGEIFEPYSKLLIGYAIQAIHSIRHLKDLKNDVVRKDYFIELSSVLSSIIPNSSELLSTTSDYDLETRLKRYLNTLSDGDATYKVNIHPKIAFPQLAECIKKSSEIFAKSYIYFLLDDVSTRYLNDNNILALVSELLFQDENCAFKFTTEAQTLEMVIMAPGNTSQAKIGRDYAIFDLGSEVNRIIHEDHHEGQEFIESILSKRAKYYSPHPKATPSRILGDTSLASIANNIVREEKASQKKGLYYGISALTAVCVGDLGDVITLYELILKRSEGNKQIPIDAKAQNSCYLELCNSRLYDLNRRETKYLDFVESFADASHHLLVQSAIRKARGETERLRQYTSIFINITIGDRDKQYKKVRELIDAGIFNLQGGPEASRTNRQGLKPQQQFKLIFRKLYGVNKHIGLSRSDRFELSGEALNEWLENPKAGKKILIGNLNPLDEGEMRELLDKTDLGSDVISKNGNDAIQQLDLFMNNEEESKNLPDYSFIKKKLPVINYLNGENLSSVQIDTLIIGLGFEDATLRSAHILSKLCPKNIVFIEFDEIGKKEEIISAFKGCKAEKVSQIHYTGVDAIIQEIRGNILCDITGLPKSIIYNTVKSALSNSCKLYISLTEPAIEYPLEDEIKKIIDSNLDNDTSVLLNEASSLLKGETGPYSIINLLPHYTNLSEPRILFSFSSAKHERLYTLLDEREYEKINIIVPSGNNPRELLSRLAAEFSLRKFNTAEINQVDINDVRSTLEQLTLDYYKYFILNNFPFEIALTGSKMQTVAVGVFCALFKVSQCWYVKPKQWDETKFTSGAKKTVFIEVAYNT